jgi:O-antigen/teichoic acid export membrane protein
MGRLAAGAIWSAAASWGRETINLGITLFLARQLGPEAYGLMGMATTVFMLGQVVLASAIYQALVQRERFEEEERDAAFWLACGLGLLASLITAVSAPLLGGVFARPEIVPLALALSPLPIVTAVSSFQTALLTREMKFSSLTLRSLCGVSVGGVVGLGMALAGYGAASLVGLFIAQGVAELATLLTSSRWRPRLRVSQAIARDLAKDSLWLIGTSLFGYADQQIFRGFVGFVYGPAVLGFYVMSWRMIDVVLSLIVKPITSAALVAFARSQNEPEKVRAIFLAATSFVALISFPAFSGCLVLAPKAIPLVFGQHWTAGVEIFQVLCGFALSDAMLHTYDTLIVGMGRRHQMFAITVASVPMLVVLLLVFGGWGPTSAGLVMLVRNVLLLPLFFRAMADLVGPIHMIEIGRYARLTMATAAMALAVFWWLDVSLSVIMLEGALTTSVLVGVATYLVAVFVIDRPSLLEAYRTLRRGAAAMAPDPQDAPTGAEGADASSLVYSAADRPRMSRTIRRRARFRLFSGP